MKSTLMKLKSFAKWSMRKMRHFTESWCGFKISWTNEESKLKDSTLIAAHALQSWSTKSKLWKQISSKKRTMTWKDALELIRLRFKRSWKSVQSTRKTWPSSLNKSKMRLKCLIWLKKNCVRFTTRAKVLPTILTLNVKQSPKIDKITSSSCKLFTILTSRCNWLKKVLKSVSRS